MHPVLTMILAVMVMTLLLLIKKFPLEFMIHLHLTSRVMRIDYHLHSPKDWYLNIYHPFPFMSTVLTEDRYQDIEQGQWCPWTTRTRLVNQRWLGHKLPKKHLKSTDKWPSSILQPWVANARPKVSETKGLTAPFLNSNTSDQEYPLTNLQSNNLIVW